MAPKHEPTGSTSTEGVSALCVFPCRMSLGRWRQQVHSLQDGQHQGVGARPVLPRCSDGLLSAYSRSFGTHRCNCKNMRSSAAGAGAGAGGAATTAAAALRLLLLLRRLLLRRLLLRRRRLRLLLVLLPLTPVLLVRSSRQALLLLPCTACATVVRAYVSVPSNLNASFILSNRCPWKPASKC